MKKGDMKMWLGFGKMRFVLAVFFLGSYLWGVVQSEADMYKSVGEKAFSSLLDDCYDAQLNLSFRCHAEWRMYNIDDAVIIVISEEDPVMTLTVSRFDTKIKFLEQITSRMLKQRNLYEDGFQMERVEFAGRQAMKVKAFAKNKSFRRLVDHFFIQDDVLYGVLFTVQPKEAWDEHQHLIKHILESIDFSDRNQEEQS